MFQPKICTLEFLLLLFVFQDTIPFAVVGSNVVVEVNNKKVRGRSYPWGVVEVENMEHCDFVTLRNMLIRWERGRGEKERERLKSLMISLNDGKVPKNEDDPSEK